jgi:glycosyltransferase involved in cell wall biosynthesis
MNYEDHSMPQVAVIAGPQGPGHAADTLEQLARHGVPGFELAIAPDTTPTDVADFDVVHDLLVAAPSAGIIGCGAERRVLSPSRAADRRLVARGVPMTDIRRWRPGVDRQRFTPAAYSPEAIPPADGERVNLLYAGPLAHAGGIELLTDAFLRARRHDLRLHLLVAGSGPDEAWLRRQLGPDATFLGQLEPDALARVYATSDLLVFPSADDPVASAVLEAQASGLPVLAVDGGGADDLIQSGRSGCLVPPSAAALAEAMHGLARRATLRERLVTGALSAVPDHTWERSLARLGLLWAELIVAGGRSPGAMEPVTSAAVRMMTV